MAAPVRERNRNGTYRPKPFGDSTLYPRELEIIELIKDGHANDVIAQLLGITVETVKSQLYRIFDKTGCGSRLQLALKFLQGPSVEDRVRDLLIEKAEITRRLEAVNESLTLLGGACDEEKEPVVYDLSARTGIALILADLACGHPDMVHDRHAERKC